MMSVEFKLYSTSRVNINDENKIAYAGMVEVWPKLERDKTLVGKILIEGNDSDFDCIVYVPHSKGKTDPPRAYIKIDRNNFLDVTPANIDGARIQVFVN